jgi:hypothetical protein
LDAFIGKAPEGATDETLFCQNTKSDLRLLNLTPGRSFSALRIFT